MAKKTTPTEKAFKIQSAGGEIEIKDKISGKFFSSVGNNTQIHFFILPGLKSFDGIIGDDTLKELEAIIDRKNNLLKIKPNIIIPLKEKCSTQVNNLEIRDGHLREETKNRLYEVLKKHPKVFGPINDQEIVNTTVQAEIKTTTDEPIYTKSYPYPANMRQEVENQITQLLKDGIIRPSKSPYNSPIWIVEKKSDASGIKKYRMVIDFKRLNAVTVSDTYPIPDISSTIASLGNSKFFTTLDLTSGFHQIKMKEKDICKTAFSTMNGKFEFTRLPFGLKNAPAIFQRMIDDVLKEYIGKICYVYIDDIIIFGKSETEHLENIDKVLSKLEEANLKINLDKTEFLKTETEFLGFLITSEGIKPDEKKIRAIKNIKPPDNLKDLKSFIGLTSYYRRFIKDFAKVVKPLTNLTRGENGQIKASQSKKIKIFMGEKELKAFNNLKELLTSPEILRFPDFDKPFILTTDASEYAIGAVLSQGEIGKDKPITYISRSLNKTEEGYATNEREMLAIVWALDNLRNYLYGAKKIKILTDHQPLTFSLSNRNTNAKLKRWKARIEEYNYELVYKPGKTNLVADALSRLKTDANVLTTSSSQTAHSAEEDSTDLIPSCEAPINVFRNQLIIDQGKEIRAFEEPHPGYRRHYVSLREITRETLTKLLKEKLDPNILNGIKIPEQYIQTLQEVYKEKFSKFKIRLTQRVVQDIAKLENQVHIIEQEHRRAHRNHEENKNQILERFYFPKMSKEIKKYVKACEICNINKYDRHPYKPELQETPVPTYPSEILHLDIIEFQGEKFISCIDKFSKFAKFFRIKDKSVLHLREKLTKILHFFTVPKILVIDNEKSLISPIISSYIRTLGIELYRTPSQKSEVNGSVERVHSTIIEITRCLRREYPDLSLKEIINISVDRYNNTLHSVTKMKPSDIFFGRTQRVNYQNLLDFKAKVNKDLTEKILKQQKIKLTNSNAKREKPITYNPGQTIYVAVKQIQGKNKPIFKKEIVEKDNKVTVNTVSGRRVHKSHIKNISN